MFDGYTNEKAVNSIWAIECEWTRPSVLFRPRIFLDGNKWCALYGEDLMSGVCAFGDSPADAASKFDEEWKRKVTDKSEAPR